MKRNLLLAVMLTWVLALTACQGGEGTNGNTETPTDAPTATIAPTVAPTETPTPVPAVTDTPVPTVTNAPTPEPTATNTPTPEPTATNTPTPEPTATSTPTPTPEPTATSTPTPSPSPTNTPTPTPTNTPTPTPTNTPTPTPRFTFKNLDKEMYAKSSVNVRDLPSSEGSKVGSLSAREKVKVTGQCKETNWYRIVYDGKEAYVSGNYLVDNKPTPTPTNTPKPTATPKPTSIPSPTPNPLARYLEDGEIVIDAREDMDTLRYSNTKGLESYIKITPEVYYEPYKDYLPEYYCGTLYYYSDTTSEEFEKYCNFISTLVSRRLKQEYPEYKDNTWFIAGGLPVVIENLVHGKDDFFVLATVYKDWSYAELIVDMDIWVDIDFKLVE